MNVIVANAPTLINDDKHQCQRNDDGSGGKRRSDDNLYPQDHGTKVLPAGRKVVPLAENFVSDQEKESSAAKSYDTRWGTCRNGRGKDGKAWSGCQCRKVRQ